jgi:hypothetical protein
MLTVQISFNIVLRIPCEFAKSCLQLHFHSIRASQDRLQGNFNKQTRRYKGKTRRNLFAEARWQTAALNYSSHTMSRGALDVGARKPGWMVESARRRWRCEQRAGGVRAFDRPRVTGGKVGLGAASTLPRCAALSLAWRRSLTRYEVRIDETAWRRDLWRNPGTRRIN